MKRKRKMERRMKVMKMKLKMMMMNHDESYSRTTSFFLFERGGRELSTEVCVSEREQSEQKQTMK